MFNGLVSDSTQTLRPKIDPDSWLKLLLAQNVLADPICKNQRVFLIRHRHFVQTVQCAQVDCVLRLAEFCLKLILMLSYVLSAGQNVG